jgi:hypothetical protein
MPQFLLLAFLIFVVYLIATYPGWFFGTILFAIFIVYLCCSAKQKDESKQTFVGPGGVRCSKCGRKSGSGATVCLQCRHQNAQIVPTSVGRPISDTIKCSKCGTANPYYSNLCKKYGQKFTTNGGYQCTKCRMLCAPKKGELCAHCFEYLATNTVYLQAVKKLEAKPRPTGGVYMLRAGEFYKIGKASKFDQRIKQLKIQLPHKVEVVHKIYTDDHNQLERYWHRRFKHRKTNSEWFRLEDVDVEEFKNYSPQ